MALSQQAQDKRDFWQHWIDKDLRNDVSALLASREIQRSWNDILEPADYPPRGSGMFNYWVGVNYRNSIMVAIRALTDKGRRTRSLMQLLQDLDRDHELLRQLGMDPSPIRNHIQQLTDNSDQIKRYVNLNIAHIANQKPRVPLTFEEVHQAADDIYNIYHYWRQIICGVTAIPPTVTETLRDPWEHLFTRPWITPEQATQIVEQRKAEHHNRAKKLTE